MNPFSEEHDGEATVRQDDMQVSVLGFGGAEIGYESVAPETVARLLNSALDAGLNVIDTAECYHGSEELIGQARRGGATTSTCSPSAATPRLLGGRGLAAGVAPPQHRAQPETAANRSPGSRSSCIVVLRRNCVRGTRSPPWRRPRARPHTLTSATAATARRRATHRVWPLRYLADVREHCRPGGADAHAAAGEGAADWRDRQRPIANAAWRTGQKPANPYHHVYWERLQKLAYDWLRGDPKDAIATALRFTLSVPGVDTAIVGTTKPDRWRENAAIPGGGAAAAGAVREDSRLLARGCGRLLGGTSVTSVTRVSKYESRKGALPVLPCGSPCP